MGRGAWTPGIGWTIEELRRRTEVRHAGPALGPAALEGPRYRQCRGAIRVSRTIGDYPAEFEANPRIISVLPRSALTNCWSLDGLGRPYAG